MLTRREALLGLTALGLQSMVEVANAQAYPTRPIKLIVPTTAGGVGDFIARSAAEVMSRVLGQPFIIENRPGAASTLAASVVAKAQPDGYTILLSTEFSMATAALVRKDLSYDPQKDFFPLGILARFPLGLIVNADLPVRTVKELIEYVRARPNQLNYASAGAGTAYHLAAEMFLAENDLKMVHVPYQGGGPILTSLMRRDTDVVFAALNTFLSHIASGKVRVLAVANDERVSAVPDVPTFAEAGFTNFRAGMHLGLAVPRATPKEVVRRLSSALAEVWSDPQYRSRMMGSGVETPKPHSPQDYAEELDAEAKRWKALIVKHKLRFD